MPAPQPASPAAPRNDAELSEFLLRACHDLRSPLRNMRLHAELIGRGRGTNDDDFEKSLGFVVSSAVAVGSVVDGITEYALALAIDPGRFGKTPPLDILVRSAIAKLGAQIREAAAEIKCAELPAVRGDADRLQQLFEHLLDDAIRRRGSNNPAIAVMAEQQDDVWIFSVADNCGMDAGVLERAFTPFAKAHPNQRPGPGLAVCRAIVERHGGRMWVESDGEHCLFRFTLPEG